jgi:hypothetical protein
MINIRMNLTRKILLLIFFIIQIYSLHSKTVVFSGNFIKITENLIYYDKIRSESVVLFLDSTKNKCDINKLLYDFINDPLNFYTCISKCPIIGDDFSGLTDKNINRRYKIDDYFYYIMNETRDVPYTSLSFIQKSDRIHNEFYFYYTVKLFTTKAKFVVHKNRECKFLSFYDGRIFIDHDYFEKGRIIYYPIKKNRKDKIIIVY